MKAKGLQDKNKFDRLMEAIDEREREFNKRLKKACDAADVDIKFMSVTAKDDTIVLYIPLKKLIGPETREFCSDKWNTFFEKAGISVDFLDNIDDAVDGMDVVVPLTFDKNNFQEIE